MEITTNTWEVAELILPQVAKSAIANPLRVKAIAESRIKTDKVDAAVLLSCFDVIFCPRCGAEGVYDGLFNPCWGELEGVAEAPSHYYRRYWECAGAEGGRCGVGPGFTGAPAPVFARLHGPPRSWCCLAGS
jgi:hypothetical protein